MRFCIISGRSIVYTTTWLLELVVEEIGDLELGKFWDGRGHELMDEVMR